MRYGRGVLGEERKSVETRSDLPDRRRPLFYQIRPEIATLMNRVMPFPSSFYIRPAGMRLRKFPQTPDDMRYSVQRTSNVPKRGGKRHWAGHILDKLPRVRSPASASLLGDDSSPDQLGYIYKAQPMQCASE